MNNSGHLDSIEILNGLSNTLHIHLSEDESYYLTNYLDKDGNGLIEEDEFTLKINYSEYQKRSHQYVISEQNFIEKFLSIWIEH